MGINISLYKGNREHPDWDSARYSGDRDFAGMLDKLPHVRRGDEFEGEYLYRPSDFAAWRREIAARDWPNPGRFERMVDLLEQDPDYWIYFGW